MSAALAVVGGAAVASTALATERAADSNDARQVEDGEGSGEGVEGRENVTCKPWLCPQPLYGVPMPDWELREGVDAPAEPTDDTIDESNERG